MDVEEKHVRILDTNKAEKRFRKLLIWIVAAISMTLVLFILFPKNLQTSGKTVGDSFTMGDNTFVFADAKRYSNQTYRLGLYVSDNQINPLSKIVSKVRTKSRENGKLLKSQVKQVSSDYYVVTVKSVPAKQSLLYLLIGDEKTTGDGLTAASSQALLVDSVKNFGKYSKPSDHQLEQEYLTYMTKFYSQRIKKYQHDVRKNQSDVTTLKKTLSKQKQSLELQTGSQRSDTKDKIAETKSAIKQHQTSIKNYEKAISNARVARTNYAKKLN